MRPSQVEGSCLVACAGLVLLLQAFGFSWAWALALGMGACLLRHLFQLVRLIRLLRRRHYLSPPFPWGLWGELYRTIARYQQGNRKRRKRQLRFQRRFREAAHSIPDALVVLDKRQRIEWANPAARELLNIHWPEDEGRRFTDCFDHPQLKAFLDTGEFNRPLDLLPNHNRALMLSLRVNPFGERKRQRLIVARDRTAVYHLNRIRRDFIANASHELRTPLTVLTGFLETLSDSPQTPAAHQRPLQLMSNQAERMRAIVEDLLTLSRLEMEDRSEDLVRVPVPEAIRAIAQEAEVLSRGRHALHWELDERLGLLANPGEIRSAFSNLIFNAVIHTPPGTRIQIRWHREEGAPVFTVADNGEGIPPEHIPRLTERFYRVDKARSRASGGTGLGLAIVNHILQRHDARLLIASELGQGSVFQCRFPPEAAVQL